MIGAAVLVVAGVLVAASGFLGLTGRLARNRWAGVRTSATMRDDRAFRVGNQAAGPAVVGGGVVAILCGVIAMASSGSAGWVLGGVIVMVLLVVAGGVRGDRAARGA
jgi:uncharacterized membrane protein